MAPEQLQKIAAEVQLLNTLEQKQTFLFTLGALTARIISLRKAAEILNLDAETFSKILELLGVEFSYLTDEDITAEKNW